VRGKIITYTRKVGRCNREFNELRYFVKWKGCAKNENKWESPEELGNAPELPGW